MQNQAAEDHTPSHHLAYIQEWSCESVTPGQTRFSRNDVHTKELHQLLSKQLTRLQDPSTQKWSIQGEVVQRAESPN